VADITYFRTKKEGAVYGHLITDAYSRTIVGYHVSLDMKASSSAKSLNFALKNRSYNKSLIHHSDRGSQYCSVEYTDILKEHNVNISMTQNGSPYDNAVAERVNGILK
jgi:putative transposase